MDNFIIADRGEPFTVTEELQKLIRVDITSANRQGFLDYTFYDYEGCPVTIERKEVHDLAGRVDDLEQQLRRALNEMQGLNGKVGLLVEGLMHPINGSTILYKQKMDGSIFYRDRVVNRPYNYYAGFECRLWQIGIPVFKTCGTRETANFLAALVKICRENPDMSHMFQKVKLNIPKDVSPQMKTLLGMGLGQVVSTKLLEKFKTVDKIIHTKEKDIVEIHGVGEATVKKIKIALGRDE
jgi:ERCC4-type nuclease